MIARLLNRISLRLVVTLMCIVTFVYGSLHAASDGSLGSSSTGTFSVSLFVPALYKISKIKDLQFGVWSGSGNLTKNDNVCVYTNVPTGTYRVTLVGDGPGGSFTVDDGSGNTMDYIAFWNDQTGASGNVQVSSGVPLGGQTGACTSASNCSGCGNNTANVRVRFTSQVLSQARAGIYNGNIAITIEPD